MPYNPAIHNSYSIRLPAYDYTQSGAYFLTIFFHKKEHLLGEVYNAVVQLSPLGKLAEEQWLKIPNPLQERTTGYLRDHAESHPKEWDSGDQGEG